MLCASCDITVKDLLLLYLSPQDTMLTDSDVGECALILYIRYTIFGYYKIYVQSTASHTNRVIMTLTFYKKFLSKGKR